MIAARYTPATDTWTLLKQPSIEHRFGSACASNGCIYLCGGGWNASSDAIEEYDIEKDEWTVSTMKLPQPLTFCTVAVVNFL